MRNDTLALHYNTTFLLTFNFFPRINTFKNNEFKLNKNKYYDQFKKGFSFKNIQDVEK